MADAAWSCGGSRIVEQWGTKPSELHQTFLKPKWFLLSCLNLHGGFRASKNPLEAFYTLLTIYSQNTPQSPAQPKPFAPFSPHPNSPVAKNRLRDLWPQQAPYSFPSKNQTRSPSASADSATLHLAACHPVPFRLLVRTPAIRYYRF